jgi:hypothetical protein
MTEMHSVSLLAIAQRWGGGPLEERWRGLGGALDPSTMPLRAMVPLPTGYAGREEL